MSTWWLGTGGGGYTLNAEESDDGLSHGFDSDAPYGSIAPSVFLSLDIYELRSNDAPYTIFTVTGSLAQGAFTSMTIDGVTVDTIDAIYANAGGVSSWQWNGENMIPIADNYTVTFT